MATPAICPIGAKEAFSLPIAPCMRWSGARPLRTLDDMASSAPAISDLEIELCGDYTHGVKELVNLVLFGVYLCAIAGTLLMKAVFLLALAFLGLMLLGIII